VETTPVMMPALLRPGGRFTGTSTPASSRSYSVKVPPLPVIPGISSYGYVVPRARERCTFWL
jgi:hypothetical protein